MPRLIVLLALIFAGNLAPLEARDFGIGFFEGGEYPAHSALRNEFRDQIRVLAPEGVHIVFISNGFKSAGWNRDSSRVMAHDLTANREIDLVLALGPWTVEDLLAAGFDRPIVAAFRVDPITEKLLTERGRPIVDNLTVRVRPRKLETDLRYLASLLPVERLAILSFPSDDTTNSWLTRCESIGEQLGFEIVTATGIDRNGTYAFFNAYRALGGSVEAIYLPPLWGFNPDKIRQFYSMLARDGVAAISAEGRYHAERGALAVTSVESSLERATYHVWKTVQIINGATPADLPVVLEDSPGLTVNGAVAHLLGMNLATGLRPDLDILEAPPGDEIERLTVVDAVTLALAQNPGLEAVRTRFLAAEQTVASARAAYYPQVNLYGETERVDRNSVNNHHRYDRTQYRAGLRLEQELLALDVIRDVKLSDKKRQIAAEDSDRAALDLELAVTATFLDLYAADQIRLIETDHVRKAAASYRLARLRLELDDAGPADVWRLEQEWLQAQIDRRQAETKVAIARAMLNALLGRPADYPFVQDWNQFSDSRFFTEQAWLQRVASGMGKASLVDQAVNDALAGNPELRSANLRVDLARSELDRTRAGFYPTIGFYAGLDFADELADQTGWDEKSPTWSLGARVDIPLFQGGKRFRERSRYEFGILEQQSLHDEQAIQLRRDLTTVFENIYGRAESFPLAARVADLAHQYYPAIKTDYASGQADLTKLMESLQNDRAASVEAVLIQIDYFLSVAKLHRLRGVSAGVSNRSSGEELVDWLSRFQP